MFKSIYQYRELLKTNVKKDIRGKYKASVLGVLWSFINPLLQVAVYAIVFPYILGASQQNYILSNWYHSLDIFSNGSHTGNNYN